jgi:hypothetical protein
VGKIRPVVESEDAGERERPWEALVDSPAFARMVSE